MTTRAIGERWRLAWLALRHGARQAWRGLTAPLRLFARPWRGGAATLIVAPQDLRTADPTVASDIYAGYFAFAGKVVAAAGRSPFEIEPPSPAWTRALMGFGWLRHLRAADSALARANARALVDDWISACARARGPAWEGGVVARRLLAWLSQSPTVLEGADADFYRRFVKSIGRQARFLAKRLNRIDDGEDRLTALVALASVALCTGNGGPAMRGPSRRLGEELEQQILPDGGHVGRNPQSLIDLLTDLLPLRQLYANQGVEAPAGLQNAIDRMMPMLGLFRHGDGSLALFNGMGATPIDTLATLLAYHDVRAQANENAHHSGYLRLSARQGLVVMDVGPPPPFAYSSRAHAGCLSFEFSDGPSRVIVNCGAPSAGSEQWRPMARATAAHSTLVVNDTSSCRFVAATGLAARIGSAILSGPREVAVTRAPPSALDAPALTVEGTHDGYLAPFGLLHRRRLVLAADGHRLDGQDGLIAVHSGRAATGSDAFALRFHLHPSVRASLAEDALSVVLTPAGGAPWTFSAGGLPVAIEESIFFAAPGGARRCEQIVVAGAWRTAPALNWALIRMPAGVSDPPTS